jgi:hypothetical protein
VADTEDIFQIGAHILKTSVSDKTKQVLAQIGDVNGEGQVDAEGAVWMQHIGFCSRPADPEKGKEAAQAFLVRGNGRDVVIASQDPRFLDIYGNLAPGETCVFATGPDGAAQGRILIKADGSINLFTKSGNAAGGSGMGIFVNADGSISIASHNGAAILVGTDGSLKLFNGSGGVQVLADGHIKLASGSKVEISGSSITMGGPSALPVAIGPHTATCIAGLQTQITALQVEIAAVAAALVACMNIPGPILPPHGTAAAAATTAVGVAAGILVTSAVAVGTSSALVPALRTSAD